MIMEIFNGLLSKSPEWAVGISLILFLLGTQVFTYLKFKKINKTTKEEYKDLNAKTLKISYEMFYLEKEILPEEQMSPVKDYLKDVQVLCSTDIRHFLINEKGVDDSLVNKDVSYLTYNSVLRDMLYQLVKVRIEKEFKELREKFSRNIFTDLISFDQIADAFEIHKQRTITTLINSAKDFMSERWIPLALITRKEGLRLIDLESMEKLLIKSFDSAIKLQIQYFKRIQELENEITT